MRNLAPSGGTSTPAEARVCDLPAGLRAPLTPPSPPPGIPSDLTPDARACLDALATAGAAAAASRERLDDALARYHAIFGPPELARDDGGKMRRNPAAVAFHARADAEEATAEARTPGLLTKAEAAARLRIGVRSLERLVAEGRLCPVRISARCVRFDGAALDAFARTSARSRPVPRKKGQPAARPSTPRPVAASARTSTPARAEARR